MPSQLNRAAEGGTRSRRWVQYSFVLVVTAANVALTVRSLARWGLDGNRALVPMAVALVVGAAIAWLLPATWLLGTGEGQSDASRPWGRNRWFLLAVLVFGMLVGLWLSGSAAQRGVRVQYLWVLVWAATGFMLSWVARDVAQGRRT